MPTSEISIQKHQDNNRSTYNHTVIGKSPLSQAAYHPTSMGIDYYARLLTTTVKSYSN